jgi:endonuclease/exonuclease/phosphatase (EEP) superfamily protein YafD
MSLKAYTFWIIKLAVLVLLALTIVGFFGAVHRFFEYACSFRLQYFWISILIALLFLTRRYWKWLALTLICFAINATQILPLYSFDHYSSEKKQKPLKLISMNVNFRNKNSKPILNFMNTSDADVIAVQEATRFWLNQFESLKPKYPHRRYQENRNNHGLVILSQIPFQKVQSSNFDVPFINATLKLPEKPISIVTIHFFTPMTEWMFKNRNFEFLELGSIVNSGQNSMIVAGDFNASTWSPTYQAFVRKTHLNDARVGFGVFPTFPTNLPLIMIPIDQCLVSSDLKILDFHSGPNIGSDHLPVIVEVAFP